MLDHARHVVEPHRVWPDLWRAEDRNISQPCFLDLLCLDQGRGTWFKSIVEANILDRATDDHASGVRLVQCDR